MGTCRRVLAAGCLVAATSIVNAQTSERPIAIGTPVAATIAGAEVHAFTLPAGASSMVKFVAMQDGVDLVVTLRGPDGQVITEIDSPNGSKGPERLQALLEVPGTYRVEIRRLEDPSNPASGRYEATLSEVRPATEAERREHNEQRTLQTLEAQWESALERHDLDSMGRLLADDFAAFPAGPGAPTDKASHIASFADRFKQQPSATEVHTITNRITKLFGDTAVSSGAALVAITDGGRTSKLPGRFIHVWRRQGDTWKMAADYFHADGSVPETRTETRVGADDLARISGRYESVDGFSVNVGVEGGGLLMTPVDQPNTWKLPFVPETPAEYFTKSGDLQLAFLKGAAPTDDKLLVINNGRVNRLKRVAR